MLDVHVGSRFFAREESRTDSREPEESSDSSNQNSPAAFENAFSAFCTLR